MSSRVSIAFGALAVVFAVLVPLRGVTDEPILRVGHGVTAPRPLNHPNPEYSEAALKAGFQGTCVLSLVVDKNGKPESITVSRSLGMGLNEKSIEAVQNWTFEPARKNGKPVAVRISVVITFRTGKDAMTPKIRAALNRARKANDEFRRTMWKRVYRVEGDAPAPLCHSEQRGDEDEAAQVSALGLEVDPRQYKLKSITFTDNKTLTNAAALRTLFPIKDGEPFDFRRVSDGLQQLRKAYGSQGFITFKDTVRADVDDSHRDIALRIKCEEGRQFFVDHINVAGMDEATFQKLRKTLYVKPGELYNERLADLWLEKNSRFIEPSGSIRNRLKLDINESLGTVAMTYDFTPCVN